MDMDRNNSNGNECETDIVLIYPQLGSWDNALRDIPLSLIYAATDSVKRGFNVKILDLRLYPNDWEVEVDKIMANGCLIVGLSVMTGNPIITSLKVSKYVKEKYGVPVVWGGAHPTILPEQTLENQYIDYVIRDWGSLSLCQLLEHLKFGTVDKTEIRGLGYKENGEIKLSSPQDSFEMLDFRDLPYHLVDISGDKYNRFSDGSLTFPIYTSMGCPWKCSFCMAPAVYEKIKGKKWLPHDVDYVLDHIQYLSERYEFRWLQIYDDESFIDLERMRRILLKYIERGYHKRFRIEFRGVRINDLDRMDDEYLQLLVDAGVELMMIGMESGSPRVLKLMNKGIQAEQTIRVNQHLAHFPQLRPHYNFFCGIPGEDIDSLIETKDFIMKLVKEHPHCRLGFGAHWKAIPGSVATERAVKEYGYKLPDSLEEWGMIDSVEVKDLVYPWYTDEMIKMIKLIELEATFYGGDRKHYTSVFGEVIGTIIYSIVFLYRPLLRYRLRTNNTFFMFEGYFRDWGFKNFGKVSYYSKQFSNYLRKLVTNSK